MLQSFGCYKLICLKTLFMFYNWPLHNYANPTSHDVNKFMHIEMFNVVENTRKLPLVWIVVKPNQLEQKLCIAKNFLVLAAMLVSLKRTATWPPRTLKSMHSCSRCCWIVYFFLLHCSRLWLGLPSFSVTSVQTKNKIIFQTYPNFTCLSFCRFYFEVVLAVEFGFIRNLFASYDTIKNNSAYNLFLIFFPF